jgi:hypothetical protein
VDRTKRLESEKPQAETPAEGTTKPEPKKKAERRKKKGES